MGASAGTNVVSVTTATATPARFHAQAFGVTARTLFNNVTMGTGGGTLRYSKTGDPLNGLTVTVPVAAYPVATVWTIVADSSVLATLPAGFSQVGPTLVIGNNQDFADSVMTLTMPMRLAANETAAPFYFDPASGTLEGIPVVAATDSSVTLATRHFTSNEMAIPGTGPSLSIVRGARLLGFGNVRIVWVRAATAQLVGTFTSTFMPGVDDWEFINYGDYIGPHGDCEGMSITTMFYHYFFHPNNQGPGLFHQFDQSLANQWDNVQGIRFAGSVQGDFSVRWNSGIKQVEAIVAQGIANGTPTKFLTASWIALTLQLTRQPVLLNLYGPVGGHAVVAYAVTVNGPQVTVLFADPNAPGVSRTMAFQNGILDPVPLQLNALSQPDYFDLAFALGVTSEVPLKQIVSRWSEFKAQQAGSDRYPKQYHLEDSISTSTTWNQLAPGDTVYTAQAFALRHRCSDCPTKRPGLGDMQFIKVWNAAGSAPLLAGDTLPNPLPDGISSYQMVLWSLTASDPGSASFVDALPITIKYHKFSATAPAGMVPGVPAKLSAHPGALATFQSVYTWTFNDGGTPAVVTVIGDSTVMRAFPPGGPYAVTVSLVDPVHAPLGLATATVSALAPPTDWAWQFTSATLTNATLPPGGIGSEALDTTIATLFNGLVANLQASPGNSLFWLINGSCQGLLLEQFPAGQFRVGLDSTFGGAIKGIFADNCVTAPDYISSLTLGTLGSGVVVGSMVDVPQPDRIELPGGSINAVMNGTTLSGTFTWRVRFSTGAGVYSFNFQATQVLPKP
jgi:hypothetical protein